MTGIPGNARTALFFIPTKCGQRAEGNPAKCLKEEQQITNSALAQSRQSIGNDWRNV